MKRIFSIKTKLLMLRNLSLDQLYQLKIKSNIVKKNHT